MFALKCPRAPRTGGLDRNMTQPDDWLSAGFYFLANSCAGLTTALRAIRLCVCVFVRVCCM